MEQAQEGCLDPSKHSEQGYLLHPHFQQSLPTAGHRRLPTLRYQTWSRTPQQSCPPRPHLRRPLAHTQHRRCRPVQVLGLSPAWAGTIVSPTRDLPVGWAPRAWCFPAFSKCLSPRLCSPRLQPLSVSPCFRPLLPNSRARSLADDRGLSCRRLSHVFSPLALSVACELQLLYRPNPSQAPTYTTQVLVLRVPCPPYFRRPPCRELTGISLAMHQMPLLAQFLCMQAAQSHPRPARLGTSPKLAAAEPPPCHGIQSHFQCQHKCGKTGRGWGKKGLRTRIAHNAAHARHMGGGRPTAGRGNTSRGPSAPAPFDMNTKCSQHVARTKRSTGCVDSGCGRGQ